jgi:hypothetical protein
MNEELKASLSAYHECDRGRTFFKARFEARVRRIAEAEYPWDAWHRTVDEWEFTLMSLDLEMKGTVEICVYLGGLDPDDRECFIVNADMLYADAAELDEMLASRKRAADALKAQQQRDRQADVEQQERDTLAKLKAKYEGRTEL